jgi:uncharacterized membrane protein
MTFACFAMRRSISPHSMAALVACLAIAVVLLPHPIEVARAVAALLLVLALPGIAILSAAGSIQVGRAERVLATLGLSLAIAIFVGVLIYAVGLKLERGSWAVALGAVALGASALGAARARGGRSVLDSTPTSGTGMRTALQSRIPMLSPFDVAALIVTAVAVFASFAVARTGVLGQPQSGFTQLWILPSADKPGEIATGIRNQEGHPESYVLEVLDGPTRIGPARMVRLEDGASASFIDGVPTSGSAEVAARLYLASEPDKVLREVRLWLRR